MGELVAVVVGDFDGDLVGDSVGLLVAAPVQFVGIVLSPCFVLHPPTPTACMGAG